MLKKESTEWNSDFWGTKGQKGKRVRDGVPTPNASIDLPASHPDSTRTFRPEMQNQLNSSQYASLHSASLIVHLPNSVTVNLDFPLIPLEV